METSINNSEITLTLKKDSKRPSKHQLYRSAVLAIYPTTAI